jgi:putative hemolysin
MVFQLKKKIEYNLSKDRFSKLRIVLSKAKYVAKNVVYIKNWSKNIPLNSSVKKNTIDKDESKLNFSFKNYVVKIIRDPDPLLIKAKELRQKIFFNETGVHSLDSDEFDRICDHLIVIDKSISSDHVVGTYRLLLKQNENKKFKFYSESEFNISNLKRNKKNLVSEAGRSCVHQNYRDGRIIKLLWRGLASYIYEKKIDLIFGCASFPSSKYEQFINQLSYLNHFHSPPEKFLTFPLDNIEAKFKIVPKNKLNIKREFQLLPPLIKAYIRAGAWVGQGSIVDKKFDTTDVLIILKTENIIKKYSKLSIR